MSSPRVRRRPRGRPPRRAVAAGRLVASVIERHGRWLFPALVVVATVAVFAPTLGNGFVDWDDGQNLVHNAAYRGLGAAQLRWMWTTFHMGHYIPVTWMTFGLDYLLWGLNPAGYHLTNLLVHLGNSLLVYLIALRLLAAAVAPTSADTRWWRLGAAVAALLFAVHPLRVESVAWATERRDVLCGLFYLLAVLLYLRACDAAGAGPLIRQRWYWLSVGVFALALLSKSMAVTLPVVLLVLDVYPLRRIRARRGIGPAGSWIVAGVRLLAEKIPFALLSLAASVMALVALHHIKGAASVATVGILDRLVISTYALAFYLWKLLAPVRLSALYELPDRIDPAAWPYVLAALVVAALSVAAFRLRRRWPAPAAVWVSYIVILLPVLGIVQNGFQIAADRYTYLASIGWALLAGGGLRLALRGPALPGSKDGRRLVALGGGAAAVVIVLAVLTWQQTHVWRDSRSLWTHALGVEPSSMAHSNVGVLLARQGRAAEAAEHFQRALAIKPRDAELYTNLGAALAQQGRPGQAAEQFRRALALTPGSPLAHTNLGNALAQQGQLDEALQHYRESLRVNPDDPDTHHSLGQALVRLGRPAEAVDHFRRALALRPDFRSARNSLERIEGTGRHAR